MAGALENKSSIDHSHNTVQKLIENHHNIDHTTFAYVTMIGVWDVLGNNKLDEQLLVRGRSEHLSQLKEKICQAIDKEIDRRKESI